MYYINNLKNALKFKLLAFWKDLTPFIDQKCTFENVPKKLDRALTLPPPNSGNDVIPCVEEDGLKTKEQQSEERNHLSRQHSG